MANNKNGKTKSRAAGLAGAAAGAAILGASAYYLFGPNKKEHQKKAKALVERMRKEAVREAKRAKAITAPVYHRAVDSIASAYAKEYKLHEKDIKAIRQRLKGEWKNMKAGVATKVRNSSGARKRKTVKSKK